MYFFKVYTWINLYNENNLAYFSVEINQRLRYVLFELGRFDESNYLNQTIELVYQLTNF